MKAYWLFSKQFLRFNGFQRSLTLSSPEVVSRAGLWVSVWDVNAGMDTVIEMLVIMSTDDCDDNDDEDGDDAVGDVESDVDDGDDGGDGDGGSDDADAHDHDDSGII